MYHWQVGNLPMVGDNLPMVHKRHPAISKITYGRWQRAEGGRQLVCSLPGSVVSRGLSLCRRVFSLSNIRCLDTRSRHYPPCAQKSHVRVFARMQGVSTVALRKIGVSSNLPLFFCHTAGCFFDFVDSTCSTTCRSHFQMKGLRNTNQNVLRASTQSRVVLCVSYKSFCASAFFRQPCEKVTMQNTLGSCSH